MANVIASEKSNTASDHASAGAKPRKRSAREISAPGIKRHAVAAPSRSASPSPSAGSRRAKASAPPRDSSGGAPHGRAATAGERPPAAADERARPPAFHGAWPGSGGDR